MKKQRFTASESWDSKELYIHGPDNFRLGISIYYDDVEHKEVDRDLVLLMELLDKYWPKG